MKCKYITRNLRPAQIKYQATDMQDCALSFNFIIIENYVFNIPVHPEKIKILKKGYEILS